MSLNTSCFSSLSALRKGPLWNDDNGCCLVAECKKWRREWVGRGRSSGFSTAVPASTTRPTAPYSAAASSNGLQLYCNKHILYDCFEARGTPHNWPLSPVQEEPCTEIQGTRSVLYRMTSEMSHNPYLLNGLLKLWIATSQRVPPTLTTVVEISPHLEDRRCMHCLRNY
jgi:hypothetical protein